MEDEYATLDNGEKKRVIRMYLCEQDFVTLKRDILYYFEVDDNCEKCQRLC